jgi:drug/metabolite transporter (DMT)-like permease
MDGLSHTSASVSAFVTQAFCVFVPIIVAVRDRQWPEKRVVMSIVLMMFGVGILANFDIRTFHLARGEAETLLAAVFFAFQILWLERPVFAKNNVNHFSVVMFLTMALISVPILCGSARHLNDAVVCYKNPAVLAMAGSITLFCTVLAFVLMNRWQPFVPATEAAVIYGAEPVFASILALFLPSFISKWTGIDYQNERITWQLLAGGLLVFLANLVLQIRRRREKTNLTADFAD